MKSLREHLLENLNESKIIKKEYDSLISEIRNHIVNWEICDDFDWKEIKTEKGALFTIEIKLFEEPGTREWRNAVNKIHDYSDDWNTYIKNKSNISYSVGSKNNKLTISAYKELK